MVLAPQLHIMVLAQQLHITKLSYLENAWLVVGPAIRILISRVILKVVLRLKVDDIVMSVICYC